MLVILFRFLSRLPLPWMHALGKAAGWVIYACSPTYRKRLKDNLQQAGFPHSLSACIGEAGKGVFELPFIWCAPPERVFAHTYVENWEVVQQALDAGKGIVFLTPHLGCFEITAQAFAQHAPITVMYRPPRKQVLTPLLEGARARTNLSLATANLSGVRTLAKALRRGEAIGLLPDQVPQQGEGVWAHFFGRPAYTMTLSAKLQQMTGAPIILTYAERLPHGRGYLIRFMPFEGELGETPEQQARAVNLAMEQLIARCPEQYFWSYNRFKRPRGVTPPDPEALPS